MIFATDFKFTLNLQISRNGSHTFLVIILRNKYALCNRTQTFW